jgi:3-methyladenine DNA glycosylase AlkC
MKNKFNRSIFIFLFLINASLAIAESRIELKDINNIDIISVPECKKIAEDSEHRNKFYDPLVQSYKLIPNAISFNSAEQKANHHYNSLLKFSKPSYEPEIINLYINQGPGGSAFEENVKREGHELRKAYIDFILANKNLENTVNQTGTVNQKQLVLNKKAAEFLSMDNTDLNNLQGNDKKEFISKCSKYIQSSALLDISKGILSVDMTADHYNDYLENIKKEKERPIAPTFDEKVACQLDNTQRRLQNLAPGDCDVVSPYINDDEVSNMLPLGQFMSLFVSGSIDNDENNGYLTINPPSEDYCKNCLSKNFKTALQLNNGTFHTKSPLGQEIKNKIAKRNGDLIDHPENAWDKINKNFDEQLRESLISEKLQKELLGTTELLQQLYHVKANLPEHFHSRIDKSFSCYDDSQIQDRIEKECKGKETVNRKSGRRRLEKAYGDFLGKDYSSQLWGTFGGFRKGFDRLHELTSKVEKNNRNAKCDINRMDYVKAETVRNEDLINQAQLILNSINANDLVFSSIGNSIAPKQPYQLIADAFMKSNSFEVFNNKKTKENKFALPKSPCRTAFNFTTKKEEFHCPGDGNDDTDWTKISFSENQECMMGLHKTLEDPNGYCRKTFGNIMNYVKPTHKSSFSNDQINKNKENVTRAIESILIRAGTISPQIYMANFEPEYYNKILNRAKEDREKYNKSNIGDIIFGTDQSKPEDYFEKLASDFEQIAMKKCENFIATTVKYACLEEDYANQFSQGDIDKTIKKIAKENTKKLNLNNPAEAYEKLLIDITLGSTSCLHRLPADKDGKNGQYSKVDQLKSIDDEILPMAQSDLTSKNREHLGLNPNISGAKDYIGEYAKDEYSCNDLSKFAVNQFDCRKLAITQRCGNLHKNIATISGKVNDYVTQTQKNNERIGAIEVEQAQKAQKLIVATDQKYFRNSIGSMGTQPTFPSPNPIDYSPKSSTTFSGPWIYNDNNGGNPCGKDNNYCSEDASFNPKSNTSATGTDYSKGDYNTPVVDKKALLPTQNNADNKSQLKNKSSTDELIVDAKNPDVTHIGGSNTNSTSSLGENDNYENKGIAPSGTVVNESLNNNYNLKNSNNRYGYRKSKNESVTNEHQENNESDSDKNMQKRRGNSKNNADQGISSFGTNQFVDAGLMNQKNNIIDDLTKKIEKLTKEKQEKELLQAQQELKSQKDKFSLLEEEMKKLRAEIDLQKQKTSPIKKEDKDEGARANNGENIATNNKAGVERNINQSNIVSSAGTTSTNNTTSNSNLGSSSLNKTAPGANVNRAIASTGSPLILRAMQSLPDQFQNPTTSQEEKVRDNYLALFTHSSNLGSFNNENIRIETVEKDGQKSYYAVLTNKAGQEVKIEDIDKYDQQELNELLSKLAPSEEAPTASLVENEEKLSELEEAYRAELEKLKLTMQKFSKEN